jgi:hypothetical protein
VTAADQITFRGKGVAGYRRRKKPRPGAAEREERLWRLRMLKILAAARRRR